MADVFSSSPGGVMVFNAERLFPAALSVEGLTVNGSAYATQKVLVQKVDLDEAVARQLSHTLGNMVNIYVFGKRAGNMAIGGYYFWDSCDGSPNGVSNIYKYYRANNLTARATPVRVAIGTDLVFRALLRGIVLGGTDPQFGIGQFSLLFDYLPTGG